MSKQTQAKFSNMEGLKTEKKWVIIFLGEEKKSFIILNSYSWLFFKSWTKWE